MRLNARVLDNQLHVRARPDAGLFGQESPALCQRPYRLHGSKPANIGGHGLDLIICDHVLNDDHFTGRIDRGSNRAFGGTANIRPNSDVAFRVLAVTRLAAHSRDCAEYPLTFVDLNVVTGLQQ